MSLPSGRLVLQSIGGGSRPRGFLLLRTEAGDGDAGPDWSTFSQLVLAQANSLLAIGVEKPDVMLVAERRLRAEVLTSVPDGTRPAEIPAQLAGFGFGPQVVVVAVALEPGNVVGRGEAGGSSDAVAAADLAEEAARVLERRTAAQVSRSVQARVLAGVSSALPLTRSGDAVAQAVLAVRAATAEGRRVCRFGDSSTYALLLASPSREALALVAGSALEPQLARDRLRGARLAATLEAYLAHNGQAVPAAAALGVHRHTLRNRVRKISELTGRTLDSPHDRTELWLALKAHEIARFGSGTL